MRTCIVWSDDGLKGYDSAIKLIGGKALGLHQLKALGAPIPEWATLSSDFFKAASESDSRLCELLAVKSDNPLEKAFALRNYIRHMHLDAQSAELIRAVWLKISKNATKAVTVRSSAIYEDSTAVSFAGQMDTFLNIVTEKAFLEAVIGCWMSLYSEKAVLYSISHGIDPWESGVAVVVQEMVHAEVSGRIFSVNIENGNPKEMIIKSTWGLGEGLVSGLREVDSFTVDAHARLVQSQIALKKQRMVCSENGATRYEEVEPDKQAVASLNSEQIVSLHALASKARVFKNAPLEIEFAFENATLYLLQVGLIAGYKEEGVYYDNFKLWDGARLAEVVSGVTTPLTYSVIKKVWYTRFWQFCELLGVPAETIRQKCHLFETALGLLEGRIYCNLLDLYRIIALAPGFRFMKGPIEEILGLEKVGALDLLGKTKTSFEKYGAQGMGLFTSLAKLFFSHILLQDTLKESSARRGAIVGQVADTDCTQLTPAQLLEIIRKVEYEATWNNTAFVTVEIEAAFFYWALVHFSRLWGIDKDGSLQNDLLGATETISSIREVAEVYRIAQLIHADRDLETLFLNSSPEEALDIMQNDQRCAQANEELRKFEDEFLRRSSDGLKLEAPLQKDDPFFCVSVIQQYLRKKIPDPFSVQMEAVNRLLKSQREMKEALRTSSGIFFYPRLFLYRWVIRNCRYALSALEAQRRSRERVFGVLRSLIQALGSHWEHKGIIEACADIFYLEIDEIQGYIEGSLTCLAVKKLISWRKDEFRGYCLAAPDEVIRTHGEVYYNNIFALSQQPRDKNFLKGVSCCRGSVENVVRVVRMPDTAVRLSGEIVVADRLDWTWTALLPLVSGLIVEQGGMLSHGAIMARTMGIPCVVGLKDATRYLKTGDTVLLNATEGTVTIIKRAEA